jgi:Uma2 family endonuclease
LALAARLLAFVKENHLGHVMGADAGFRLPGGNVRSPDASFVASGRFPNDRPTEDWGSLAPDLAVEVISPGDRPRPVLDKVGVWVIDPRTRRATIHRSLTDVRTIIADEFLDGEDVVPGFRCRLGDVLV